MKRPASTALSQLNMDFFPPGKVDFFPLLGRISCNLAFSDATEPAGFNEKSKDQMLQAVVQSS